MLNYFLRKKRLAGRSVYKQYATMQIGAPRAASRALVIARQCVLVMGFMAICMLGVMFVKPNLADDILALSPYANRSNDETVASELQWSRLTQSVAKTNSVSDGMMSVSADTSERMAEVDPIEKRRVTKWLAKRYRVANEAANILVSEAYAAADETKLDPLLILSVIAIESRFNPIAESPVGAKGLMQVMSNVHREKFDDHGGVKAALDPVANIRVGAKILKEYVNRGGSVEAGLKSYVGAAMHQTDKGYGAKVLSEYHRLKLVARGKYVPVTAKTVMQAKNAAADNQTVAQTPTADDTIAAADHKQSKNM